MLRFVLTVGAALILIATTSFPGICNALERLKVPRLFVVQLMLLYRFVFVLTEQALRIVRARSMRSFGEKRPGLKGFVQMVGLLFLRTLGRAERVYLAMCNRGFDGEVRTMKRLRFTSRDAVFLSLCVFLFVVFRFYDVSVHLGTAVLRVFL
jgi:cobalt/nickel transport system permease protein